MMMNDNSDRDTEQHVKMNIYEMKQKVIDDDVVEDKRLKAKYDGDHMEVVASENGNMYFMDIDDRSMLNEILNQPMSNMSLMDRLKMEMEKEEDMEEEKDMVEDMEEEDGMEEDMEEEVGMVEEEKKKKDKKKKRKSKNKTAKKKGGKKAKKSNGKKKSKKNMKLAFYGRGKTIKHKKKTGKKKTGSSKSKSAKMKRRK